MAAVEMNTMIMTSDSGNPIGQEVATDKGCNKVFKTKLQSDGSAAKTTNSNPRLLRKRSNDKHKQYCRNERRGVHLSSAERLHEEKLLRESIERHTRLFTFSDNPEFFVLVPRNDFGEEGEEPSEETTHAISDEDSDDKI